MGVNCTQVHCVTHHRLVVVVGPRPTESSESFDPTRPDQKRANGGHCCITTSSSSSSSSREDIDFHTLQIRWRVAPRSGRNTNLARIFGLVEPLGTAAVSRWSGCVIVRGRVVAWPQLNGGVVRGRKQLESVCVRGTMSVVIDFFAIF